MLAPKRLRDASCQNVPANAAGCGALFEFRQRAFGFLQGLRNAPFLAGEKFLALDHKERALETSDGKANARCTHVTESTRECLHRAATRRMLESLLGRLGAER